MPSAVLEQPFVLPKEGSETGGIFTIGREENGETVLEICGLPVQKVCNITILRVLPILTNGAHSATIIGRIQDSQVQNQIVQATLSSNDQGIPYIASLDLG